MSKYLKIFITAILLYFYIYSPALQVMPFGFDKIILILAFLYIILSRKFFEYYRKFKIEIQLLFLIVLCSFIVNVFHGNLNFEGHLMYDVFLLLEVFLVPFCLVCVCQNKWDCKLDDILIINAIVAGVISVVLLLNPQWADVMKNQILRIPEFFTTHLSFRGFGFSDGLAFPYPIIQGLCAGFIICSLVRRKSVYYLGLIPIVVSIFVNARSGIIPILVSCLVLYFSSSFVKNLKFTISCSVLIFVAVFFLKKDTSSQIYESLQWGLSFFEILGDFISGRDAENMDALSLTGTMVQLPKSFNAWILGEGVNLFDGPYLRYNNSDIGFCIRIVYGGLIYMTPWCILWFYMFKRLNRVNHKLALIMFISLVYMNWKSDFFVLTASCRFFFLIYVFCMMVPSFMNNCINNKLN